MRDFQQTTIVIVVIFSVLFHVNASKIPNSYSLIICDYTLQLIRKDLNGVKTSKIYFSGLHALGGLTQN